MPQNSNYTLLTEEGENTLPILHLRRERAARLTEYIFLAVAVVALLQSLASFTLTYTRLQKPTSLRQLEVVSQYVGLDRAAHHGDSPGLPPILSSPLLLARINASEPDKPIQESYPWESTFGTVYLQKRQFAVTGQVSTVVQFRAGDFGFENCTLVANLPSTPEAVSVPESAYAVDIWTVDGHGVSRGNSITWNNRPKREYRFARWLARPGHLFESSPFQCAWGSIHTFEFAAAADLLLPLQFVQDPTEHGTGVLLKQYETVHHY